MLRSFYVHFSCCVFMLCVEFGITLECGPNQESSCVSSSAPVNTCRDRKNYSCLEDTEPCIEKCVCKEGFFRNAVGDCITIEECDKCPGANEYFACGVACDNDCSTLQFQNKTNCPIQNIVCNRMCYCEDGFARNTLGNCLPFAECPPSCADKNEVYTDCKKSCPPETCIAIVARFKCDSKEQCEPGCVCRDGYYRIEKDSPCVEACQCPEMNNSKDCLA